MLGFIGKKRGIALVVGFLLVYIGADLIAIAISRLF
jgi:hypothetical protein